MAEQEPKHPIGFIGVGNMGAPMARCLAKAGWPVLAWDAEAKALSGLADTPAVTLARDAASVAAGARTLITMLPNGAVVREVVLGTPGDSGLAAAMAEGSLLVDMSSSDPLGTVTLGEELSRRGLAVIDAPVSGGVPRARSGTLAIMAGGDASLIDSVESMLASMGTVLRTGPLGSAHAMKALNNYVSAAGFAAACEALIIGTRFGLDPNVVTDVLNLSSGRNNATENKLKQYVISGTFDAGFSLDLLVKDVNTAHDLAQGVAVPAPGLEEIRAMLTGAAGMLGPGADHSEMFTYLESLGSAGNGKRRKDAAAE